VALSKTGASIIYLKNPLYDKLQNKTFFDEKGQPISNHDKPRK
jgi:hypothetical protein